MNRDTEITIRALGRTITATYVPINRSQDEGDFWSLVDAESGKSTECYDQGRLIWSAEQLAEEVVLDLLRSGQRKLTMGVGPVKLTKTHVLMLIGLVEFAQEVADKKSTLENLAQIKQALTDVLPVEVDG